MDVSACVHAHAYTMHACACLWVCKHECVSTYLCVCTCVCVIQEEVHRVLCMLAWYVCFVHTMHFKMYATIYKRWVLLCFFLPF